MLDRTIISPPTLPVGLKQVREELEELLNRFDWSGLTAGRKNILRVFLQLATAEGYGAVTMRTLGMALNIKPPSIYSHFPGGRDEIVTESLRWHYYNFGILVLELIALQFPTMRITSPSSD